jgi:hypothetical protein
LALAAVAGMAACSPTLDWREVRPDSSRALALFPCKPVRQSRRVPLAGAAVEMGLVACSAGGTTYALAFADTEDPSRVTPALDELSRAVTTHLQVAGTPASSTLVVRGMSPSPSAQSWRLVGRLPDGREVEEQAALFAYGTRVYQVTAMGARLDNDAMETFFGALRVGE